MNLLLILIVLIILIGIAVFGYKLMNKTVNKNRNYSYIKRIRGVFAGYIALLLICVLVSFVAPNNKMREWKEVHTKDRTDLFNDAISGKINQVNRAFKVTEWKFNYPDQKLMVNVEDGVVPNIQVVAERKNFDDHKVEAVYYRTQTTMNNLDITNLLTTPGLRLSGNQLILLKPEKIKINLSKFSNVFTINQFTGDSLEHNSEFFEGQSLLYLRIPKDLELDGTSLNIEYVK